VVGGSGSASCVPVRAHARAVARLESLGGAVRSLGASLAVIDGLPPWPVVVSALGTVGSAEDGAEVGCVAVATGWAPLAPVVALAYWASEVVRTCTSVSSGGWWWWGEGGGRGKKRECVCVVVVVLAVVVLMAGGSTLWN
jgi:hypothetical protein